MEKTILTFDEACELTGLSKNYLYKLTSQRVIPFSKPGGKKIYFRKSDLESWMLSAMFDSNNQTLNRAALQEIR